jgi:hypothetical protein
MSTFKVIIAGSRSFRDYDRLKKVVDFTLFDKADIEIVSGCQVTKDKDTGELYGADYLGEKYAVEKGYSIKKFHPEWKKYGKAAGPIRNEEMAKYADGCICFWDGKSAGTKNMIELAGKKYGLRIKVIKFGN